MSQEPSPLDALLTYLRQRRADMASTEPWDGYDFTYNDANVPTALLYAHLFMPEFVELEGQVFLRDNLHPHKIAELKAAIAEAAARSPADLKRLVDSYNWVMVILLFAACSSSDDAVCGSDAEVRLLAELLADVWRARLRARFPDRRFVVRLMEPAETGDDLGLGFEEA